METQTDWNSCGSQHYNRNFHFSAPRDSPLRHRSQEPLASFGNTPSNYSCPQPVEVNISNGRGFASPHGGFAFGPSGSSDTHFPSDLTVHRTAHFLKDFDLQLSMEKNVLSNAYSSHEQQGPWTGIRRTRTGSGGRAAITPKDRSLFERMGHFPTEIFHEDSSIVFPASHPSIPPSDSGYASRRGDEEVSITSGDRMDITVTAIHDPSWGPYRDAYDHVTTRKRSAGSDYVQGSAPKRKILLAHTCSNTGCTERFKTASELK